jgi:hypothetical protein
VIALVGQQGASPEGTPKDLTTSGAWPQLMGCATGSPECPRWCIIKSSGISQCNCDTLQCNCNRCNVTQYQNCNCFFALLSQCIQVRLQ